MIAGIQTKERIEIKAKCREEHGERLKQEAYDAFVKEAMEQGRQAQKQHELAGIRRSLTAEVSRQVTSRLEQEFEARVEV